MRALLVDDDPSIRAVIVRILSRQFDALELVECNDGVEALEELSRDHYAFMLLDLSMPNLDGFDVLESLRASDNLRTLPVIMMTGTNEERTVKRILSVGVTDYILKPIRPAQLCERVSRIVSRSEKQSGSASEEERHPAPMPAPAFVPFELTLRSIVVLADGDESFRHFFKSMLLTKCRVDLTTSGLDAFQRCASQKPQAVFIGTDLGIISSEKLAKKLREKMGNVRLIGIAPEAALAAARDSRVYDAVIPRSTTPDAFMKNFTSLIATPVMVGEPASAAVSR